MVLVPEANGFMIISRDDYSMSPCGMTFTTLMGTVGGGLQTPGMMGHGKIYVLSKKFIPVEGGIKRLVWMSKNLKEEMAEELKEVCQREGVPDLIDKIADGTVATTVDQLLPFLESKGHPALTMEPLV
jgi:acetyl-CoA synthase